MTDPRSELAACLHAAIARVAPGQPVPPLSLERPKQAQHGDYASNAALQLGKTLKRNPRELATAIAARTSLPVALHDERMSTARALGLIREQGGSTRGRKRDVDSLAAAVLLQHFLDHRRLEQ